MADVTLNHIYKVYDNGVKAVNDFNLDIKDKEFIVFVGPSGCGKSTTLRMIAGLEDITAGELKIDNEIVNDIEPKDRDIAMVFQNYALYPHMTVYENMAFGLKLRKVPKEIIHERIVDAAKILDITEYLDRKPKEMSGGQRQRVALGRAILRNPKVFLLDEPLSNLDAKLRTQMRSEILKLYKKLNTTFIYVTHDQVEAMTMGTRIVVMKKGILQQVDTPKNLYKYPINKFVAGFIGTPQMNFFNCTLLDEKENVSLKINHTDQIIKVPAKYFLKADKKYIDGKTNIIFGIRAEHIKISEKLDNNSIKIKVSYLEELGDETLVYGDLNLDNDLINSGSKIIIKTTPDKEYNPGDIINVVFDFKYVHYFDNKTEETIIPRIPKEMQTSILVIDNKMKLFGKEFNLPSSYNKLKEKKYKIFIPIDAITKGNSYLTKIVNKEEVNNKNLLYLKLGENLIFTYLDGNYNIGDNLEIDIDFKKITVFDDNQVIIKELPKLNILPGYLIKEKEIINRKKIINFKFKIYNKNFIIPNDIVSKIITSLSLNAFNTGFNVAFNLYDYELLKDGIEAKVLNILDYGNEKIIKVRVEDKIIYLNNNYDLKENDIFYFVPKFDKISISESKHNIKII